ncbi:MAG: class I tRNA ligase family protein, partial [Candidatus Paceibacteria bacterium]
YHYIWHTLADKYLEKSKRQLQDPGLKPSTQKILAYLLRNSLIMLHPFMPFVTETIWQKWHGTPKKPLIIESWPTAKLASPKIK